MSAYSSTTSPTDAVTSPCIGVCTIEPQTGYCIGCGRTLDEIMAWIHMSEAERKTIVVCLPLRMSPSAV